MKRTFIFFCFVAILSALVQGCKKKNPPPAKPIACFTVSPEPLVSQPVNFSNCTKNASTYQWSFGDGLTDFVDSSASHTYTQPGYYTVVLVTINANNDTSIVSHTIYVNALASAYPGTFGGYVGCSLTGIDSTGIVITTVKDTVLNIYNLYNTGKTFVAYANGFNITVPPQTFNTGSGDKLLQASIQLLGDSANENFNSLTMSLIVTAFSSRDACQATLFK